MTNSISIRPSKDIRTNYAQISALTRDNPVAITVNGKEDTVLLSRLCTIFRSLKKNLLCMLILRKAWMI